MSQRKEKPEWEWWEEPDDNNKIPEINTKKSKPNNFFNKAINVLVIFIEKNNSDIKLMDKFKKMIDGNLRSIREEIGLYSNEELYMSFKNFRYDELVKNIIKEQIILYIEEVNPSTFDLSYFRHLLNYLNIYKKYEEPKPKVGGGENEKELQNRLCGSSLSPTPNMKKK